MTQERNLNQTCKLEPGQIVQSKAGRDRAGIFLVLEVLDAKHVLIVDGRRRSLEHPKKKRVIHLQAHKAVIDDFETLKENRTFNNARIRKILENYKMNEEEC